MKNTLLFAICLLFIVSSCKKSGGNTPTVTNSISATVDGVNVNFNTVATAVRDTTQPSFLTITGYTAASGARAEIEINVQSNTSGLTGTYLSLNPINSAGFATLFYNNLLAGSGNQLYVSNSGGINSYTTITISSFSKTNVQGTFSGRLILVGDTTTHTVTNGMFNVAVINN